MGIIGIVCSALYLAIMTRAIITHMRTDYREIARYQMDW